MGSYRPEETRGGGGGGGGGGGRGEIQVGIKNGRGCHVYYTCTYLWDSAALIPLKCRVGRYIDTACRGHRTVVVLVSCLASEAWTAGFVQGALIQCGVCSAQSSVVMGGKVTNRFCFVVRRMVWH